MIKTIAVGLWAAVVAVLSSHAAATWSAGGTVAISVEDTRLDGL